MTNQLNWNINKKNAKEYIDACVESIDDKNFSNFKKNSKYRTILEGGDKITFDYFLGKIKELNNKSLFLSNLDAFRENDSHGDPDLYEDVEIGKFSLTTLKYVYNALEISDYIKNSEIKKIVEIGGGYGGLSIVLDQILDFDEYILIDLPEVCLLIEKYISNFKNLKTKVKTISCFDVDEYDFTDTDLTIAINSLSECNLDYQMKYFNQIISKSKYSYIVRNLFSQQAIEEHQKTIQSLPDKFLYDDTNRVEEIYSQNIIVYIKRDD
jgi:putative sugar O-methyltransferase